MKPRDIILPGIVVVLGLLIGVFILAPLLSVYVMPNSPPLFIALLYYAGLPILTVAGATFGVTWYRGRSKDDTHRQEVLGVLKTPVTNFGAVEYTPNLVGEAIVQHPLVWAEADPLYPSLIAHMKNYGDTLALLDAARDYSAQQREKMVEQIHTVENIVDQKLAGFNGLSPVEAAPEKSKPYYIKRLVQYAVYTNAQKLQEKSDPAELRVEKIQAGKRKTNQLLWGSEKLAVGNMVALRRLSKIIQSTASDPKVQAAATEIQESEKQLKTNPSLANFEEKRSEIAFALSAGRHALPGHCERCS